MLGAAQFRGLQAPAAGRRQAIFVASNGPYDFLGTNIVRNADGYRFDRLRIVQDGQAHCGFVHGTISGSDRRRRGHPVQQDAGLFTLPATALRSRQAVAARLLVNAPAAGDGRHFGCDYQLPAAHVLMPEPPPVAAWVEAWRDAKLNIAILGVLLAVLTLIFVFQDSLARSRSPTGWCAPASCWSFSSGSAGPRACSSRSSM